MIEEEVRESDELYEHFRFTVDQKQSLLRIDYIPSKPYTECFPLQKSRQLPQQGIFL